MLHIPLSTKESLFFCRRSKEENRARPSLSLSQRDTCEFQQTSNTINVRSLFLSVSKPTKHLGCFSCACSTQRTLMRCLPLRYRLEFPSCLNDPNEQTRSPSRQPAHCHQCAPRNCGTSNTAAALEHERRRKWREKEREMAAKENATWLVIFMEIVAFSWNDLCCLV